LTDDSSGVKAVHLGHLKIEHNQIWLNLPEPFDGFLTVSGLVAYFPIRVLLQDPAQVAPDRRVIIHN
jgi:hypothetical protein